MNIRILCIFLLQVVILKGEAQHLLSVQQQSDDLSVLKTELEKYHPGLYRYTSSDSIDFYFKQTEKRLTRQTPLSFYGEVAGLLNKIRCGHTRARMPEEFYGNFSQQSKFLPFTTILVGNRVLVNQIDDVDVSIERGDEILAVNRKSVTDIMNAIASHLSADGFIRTGIQKQISRWFTFYYPFYIDSDISCYELQVCGRDGIVKKVDVNGRPWKSPSDATDGEPVLSLSFSTEYALLRIKTFDSGTISRAGFSYADFLDITFSEIKVKKVSNLILDLRGNGGGDDNYGATLVSYFAREPFRYFDRIEVTDAYDGYGHIVREGGQSRMTTHDGLRVWTPANNRFTGKVYVLIDGWSFSTCADVATVLHHHGWATFIGEETGGGYDGNTSGYSRRLLLPESKITVNIPMWKYTTANIGHGYAGRGVLPDYPVKLNYLQFIEGADPALIKALELMDNEQR